MFVCVYFACVLLGGSVSWCGWVSVMVVLFIEGAFWVLFCSCFFLCFRLFFAGCLPGCGFMISFVGRVWVGVWFVLRVGCLGMLYLFVLFGGVCHGDVWKLAYGWMGGCVCVCLHVRLLCSGIATCVPAWAAPRPVLTAALAARTYSSRTRLCRACRSLYPTCEH